MADNNITIREAKRKRHEAENKIHQILSTFSYETGCKIKGVNLDFNAQVSATSIAHYVRKVNIETHL